MTISESIHIPVFTFTDDNSWAKNMAKEKEKGGGKKHLIARVAYLDKAAHLLAQQQANDRSQATIDATLAQTEDPADVETSPESSVRLIQGLPMILGSQIRQISNKAVIRLSREQKNGICKVCGTPSLEGFTSNSETENLSKERKKSWADVLVFTCGTCGTQKRFPLGIKRQKKKTKRLAQNATAGPPSTSEKRVIEDIP